MKQGIQLWFCCGIAFCCLITIKPSVAQIVPDATLPVNSKVIPQGNTSIITGGTRSGTNLFHSFAQFSVSTNGVVHFNNTLDVQNIVGRVTGRSISNIDGLIKANGAANLFLINPNGIIFGPNASLNIGGSFVGSTANSINFADGTFSTTNPQSIPLLTISVPISLEFGSAPGGIRVQGTGNSLVNLLYSPIIGAGTSLTGLRVQPGKTLALIGGDIALEGGTLTAPSGRIELGSAGSGSVSLNPTNFGWTFSYQNALSFRDIQLSQQALADASGAGGGSIAVQGRFVSLRDGSAILIQNRGSQPSGNITLRASDSLDVNGTSPDGRIASSLLTESIETGRGGDITVSTNNLVLQSGGEIVPRTFNSATGGNLTLNVSNSVQVLGFSPAYPNLFSSMSAATFGSKNAGDITLSAGSLTAKNGGSIGSATFSSGTGGNVTLNANFVELIGVVPNLSNPAVLDAATFSSGNAGKLTINTSKLELRDGGRVSTSTAASGNAGSVTINAANSVEISGTVSESANPSLVDSSATILDQALQQQFRVPPVPTGSAGNVIINTPHLTVADGGLVSVRNDGTGKAGDLQVNANSINLDNQGSITALSANGSGGNILLNVANQLSLDHKSLITATAGGQGKGGNINIDPQQTNISNGSGIAVNSTGTGNAGQLKISSNSLILNNGAFLSANTNSGEGGNIFLNASNLQLRHSSLFTAAAQGSGNGGNITINTGTLAALENSPITADAVGGTGGNIQINAQALFRSPDSPITASSRFGVSGTVRVNTLDVSRNLELAALPAIPVDYTKLIPPGCSANVGSHASKFVMTGSGGLPSSPSDSQEGETVVDDFGTGASSARTSPASEHAYNSDIENAIPSTQYEYHGGPLIEAQGWVTNSKGEVVLVANAPTYTPDVPWLKSPSCHAQ